MIATQAAGITLSRSGKILAANLPFSLIRGAALWLRGSNGCGKTTLLETLAGLLPCPDGLYSDHPLRALTCYIPIRPLAWQDFTPKKLIQHWSDLYHCPAKLGDSAAEHYAGIAALSAPLLNKNLPLKKLSAGQQQRLALLELNFKKAPVWLLDEPLASLDEAATEILLKAISAHCAQGGAAVITSHQEWPGTAQQLDLSAYRVIATNTADEAW